MKLTSLFILLSLCLNTQANYFEFFGSHVTTSGIGNQANLDADDPANNYYIPALMALTEKFNFAASASMSSTNFESINGVVIMNDAYQDPALPEQTGSVGTDYDPQYNGTLHIALPLAKNLGTIALSVNTPVGSLMKVNSGDPTLPEYVMYRSRYSRSIFYFNYAKAFLNNTLAFSIGTQLGFQAAADVKTQVSIQSGFGSYGSAKSDIKPSLGVILSALYRPSANTQTYFAYQQEMKNNLEAAAFGKVSISTTTDYILDLNVKSMIYYDPHILRLGFGHQFSMFKFYGLLEYQMWGSYKSPIVQVIQRGGGIQPSNDYESLKTEDIFVPKLGLALNLTEELELDFGVIYRPTPIQGDFSGAGNTLDTNSTILTTAGLYNMNLFDFPIKLGASFQYHMLEELNVVKSANLESGGAGNKIGSPGYKVGGSVMVGSLGMNISF
ncbi:OmpP1/FadL family transporter [Halobacteriovorax sp. HLS]|uniref:OmpP1/FadL family transporter n=1 Tax=Halobacteriovorax sp. HLS TaxID=2234000 RepID=UPI000FD83D1A|nr:hypothetical protein [Halobacteriovorax sp. HLS]